MRRFCYCDPATGKVLRFESFRDHHEIDTALGKKRAGDVVGCSKASITIPGSTVDGNVIYTARHGGKVGNNIRVEHREGPDGPGHVDRLLTVSRDGLSVVVTFGTDGAGNIMVPTAANVADLIAGDEDVGSIISASFGGGGGGEVNPAPPMPLIGGKDDGDWRKFGDRGGNCRRVNTVEVI